MTSEDEKNITTFKTFHILILGCLLSTLLVLNSNYVNDKRANQKLNEEKSKLFDEIIVGRHLQGQDTPSDAVCKRGSEDLVEYYKSGDLAKIGLEEGEIKAEKETYLTALINIIKAYTGGDDKKDSEGDVTSSGDSGRLRNLQSFDAVQDDLVTYVKHLLPILAFFVIAILAIPGWIICCFCCCCNCCCCCCCKKPGCKLPCFIFTNVFYALVVAVCIYGLSQSNNIFKGMASTECSILKFFDQFLDGETKTELPRWAGITEINNILNDLDYQIHYIDSNSRSTISGASSAISGGKSTFLGHMKTAGEKFYDTGFKNGYKEDFTYTTLSTNGDYVLDLVKIFGKFESDQSVEGYPDYSFTTDSILDQWKQEYKLVSKTADDNLKEANDGFTEILDNSLTPILDSLKSGKDTLGDLRGTFDDIKSGIADVIIDNSEVIDEKGKLGFKLVFGVLALINIAIAAFMFFICFFSGKMCTNCCCCCRCLFKCATHLLWNILALLMIITFLVGFLFALVGQIGSDAMSVISYIVSKENIGAGGDNIIVNSLDPKAKGYINRCVNGDGKIEEEIGLNTNQINSFNQLYQAENDIQQAKETFDEIKQTKHIYNLYKDRVEKYKSLDMDPKVLSVNDNSPPLSFSSIINEMNEKIKNDNSLTSTQKNEKWKLHYDEQNMCSAGTDSGIDGKTFAYLDCKPSNRDWVSSASNDIKHRAEALDKIYNLVVEANTVDDTDGTNSFLEVINDLGTKYGAFLDVYSIQLGNFKSLIHRITGKLRDFSGDNNGLFSFIKCNFIGTNLKIMLKYLKSALGGDVKTVGICLLVVGCSLMLSLSANIVMIVLINIDIENNKKNNGQTQVDFQGRVIEYKS